MQKTLFHTTIRGFGSKMHMCLKGVRSMLVWVIQLQMENTTTTSIPPVSTMILMKQTTPLLSVTPSTVTLFMALMDIRVH